MRFSITVLLISVLILGLIPMPITYAENSTADIQDASDIIPGNEDVQSRTGLVDLIKDMFSKGADYFKGIVARFTDMGSHWADVTIGKLIELGVINGYGDGTFRPDNTITRAEFSTIVRKAFKYDEVIGNSFDDTSNHWAKNEVHTLVVSGVIDKAEYGDLYIPDKNITRIEMAKMIVRAVGLGEQAVDMAGNNTKFVDNADIPSADRGYIIIASDNGIINGYPDLTFKPYGEATRAEASTMVINALDYLTRIDEEMEQYKNKDGLVDADKLPTKSFKEEGLEDIEDYISFEIDGIKMSYHPEEIIEVKEEYLPMQYEGLRLESYRVDAYEDTFIKGTNAFYWGMGRPVDLFIIEGDIKDERDPAKYEVVFLDNNNEVLDRKPAYYIQGNEVNDPMNQKALEHYPNLPVSRIKVGTKGIKGKVTLMFMTGSDDMDETKTILFYYKGHDIDKSFKSDVLKIKID